MEKTYSLKIHTSLSKRIQPITNNLLPLQIHLLHIHHRLYHQPPLFFFIRRSSQRATSRGRSLAIVETVWTEEIDVVFISEFLMEIEIGV